MGTLKDGDAERMGTVCPILTHLHSAGTIAIYALNKKTRRRLVRDRPQISKKIGGKKLQSRDAGGSMCGSSGTWHES